MAVDVRMHIRMAAIWRLSLFIICAVALFAVADASHWRADWTEDQVASLSPSSKNLIGQLDEPLMIRAYITADMPQPYAQLQRYIEDLLQSCHEAGNGNIGFEIIDPDSDPNIEASLAVMQIPKVQVQVIEDDQAQVKQGYLAMVVEFLDKKEVIPVIQSEQGLEYSLMRKIKKLTGKGRVKLAVAHGFGARELDEMQGFAAAVGEDYEITSFFPEIEEVPEGSKVVLVSGVTQGVSDIWRYRLDQFRLHGGGLLVMAGNVSSNMQAGFEVIAVDPYANDWLLQDLGVAVEPGLVMDQQASRITLNQQQGGFMFRSAVDYPFIPNVTDLDQQHIVTKGIESISLPFVSALSARDEQTTIIMRSSPYAAIQQGPPYDVNPLRPINERFSGLRMRASPLGLAYTGPQRSAFSVAPEDIETIAAHVNDVAKSRWLVVGSLTFLDDQLMQGENMLPMLNMVDWLAGDSGLIELRSRGITHRPIVKLESAERLFFKGLWVFGLPLLLLVFGMIRWWILKHRKQATS